MKSPKIQRDQIKSHLSEHTIMTLKDLANKMGCSTRTIQRKLSEIGVYSSYNLNGSYFTLLETPSFDDFGLWEYNGVLFSKNHGISPTIQYIVNNNPKGLSTGEINDILRVRTNMQLGRLVKEGSLFRKREGKNQIYLSGYENTRKNQMEARIVIESLLHEDQKRPSNTKIIDILVAFLKYPGTKPDGVVKILSTWGKRTNTREVRWVLNEYGVKKNS